MINFKKLSEVEQVESASNNATVLIEEDGKIKRVPKKEVGGAGIPTAIIKSSDYDDAVAWVSGQSTPSPRAMPNPVTFECINMTFEEAYEILSNCEPLNVLVMFNDELPLITPFPVCFSGVIEFGVPCIILSTPDDAFFWTADGVSTEPPMQAE